MPTTTLINPFTVQIDFVELAMREPDAHNVRLASVMRGYYKDQEALDRLIGGGGDPLHYETFEKHLPEEYGHLLFCISKLQPGVVGEEYFMTKGHYHTRVNTGEIYFCLQGQGYMVMKTSDGKFDAQRMTRGSLVYVPPYWGHRSVNTGGEPLTMFCVWPGDAGHNYGDIEREGFPKRIFQRDGREVIE
ncbi:MAG: glucose-6-phosphate isomerase family protein [Terrimicrobiaceae bacterium]|nr:glucose-6-phosphate isomerase family protein [Terrimicrobiaceae bacterium]